MAKFLNIEQMLAAANDSDMPGTALFVAQAEALATSLGLYLAAHLNIEVADAVWEGQEFGGLCAKFGPINEGEQCPKIITQHDDEGDWEPLIEPVLSKSERRPGKMRLASDRD